MATKIWINNETQKTIQAADTLNATTYVPLSAGSGNNSFGLPDGNTYYVAVSEINGEIYVSVQTQSN